jgi:hypothetical protein
MAGSTAGIGKEFLNSQAMKDLEKKREEKLKAQQGQ